MLEQYHYVQKIIVMHGDSHPKTKTSKNKIVKRKQEFEVQRKCLTSGYD